MSVPHGSCVKREKVISFTLASRGVHGTNRTTLKLYDLKRQENDRMGAAVFFSLNVRLLNHKLLQFLLLQMIKRKHDRSQLVQI